MKILTTPPKERKTKRQYSKPHHPFPSKPSLKKEKPKKQNKTKACNGAINRIF
jgi:hypothetical protein